MRCHVCCDDPCTCSATPPKPIREWTLRECLVEGCHVVIRELAGNPPGPALCKWHQDGKPHEVRTPERASGPPISTDEFGASVFDAIKMCGGILQLQKMQEAADPRRLKDYQAREAIMHQQLAALVPKLPVADQEQLIARYPRLFA